MRMTTKLLFLLTILFAFFKFGEPAKVMMSIYGDKGFLFHSQDLKTTDIVGFVYEDANEGFTVVNCNDTVTATNFTLKAGCTVVPTSDVTVTPSETGVAAAENEALRAETAVAFPATGVNTNFMVAKLETTASPIVTKTTAQLAGTAASLITITAVVIGSGSQSASADASIILCNDLDSENTKIFLTVQTTFGQINFAVNQPYRPIMKCIAAVRNAALDSATRSAFATFIMIVSDHADLSGSLSLLAFRSVVLLPETAMQPANGTIVVGYINGLDKCPTGNNVTFGDSPTTLCNGTISIGTSGNYSFSYNGTTYYLPVTDASGAATSTTTCEDFAFNFKYSNTLIGMLLVFMLKMLQSY